MVLSCDPSRGDCILMMIHNADRQLPFARVGSSEWHCITTSFWVSQYSDCIYHDGASYAMNLLGGVHRYTIEGSCATRDIVLKDTLPYMAYNMNIARATFCKSGGSRLTKVKIHSERVRVSLKCSRLILTINKPWILIPFFGR